MKEERILESMFEQARQEKPKRSYNSVVAAFGSIIAVPASGIEAILTKPVFLNSFVGFAVLSSVVTTQVITNKHNSQVDWQNKDTIEKIAESKPELVTIPLVDEEIEEDKVVASYSLAESENSEERTAQTQVEHQPAETVDEQLNSEPSDEELLASILDGPTQSSSEPDSIDLVDIEVLPASAEELEHALEETHHQQVRFSVHSDYTEKQLDDFFEDLNLHGINTEMKWNHNLSKDRIKKIVLEMCDAEGYVQKVVATDFETIEIFWSIDDNGFPYDVYLIFDGNDNEMFPIDLKDKLFPIHRYKG